MVIPGVSSGTTTILWRLCLSLSGLDKPMNIVIAALGWPNPVDHHFLPLMTTSSPSSIMVAAILVASDEATSGSVIPNTERISPASNGLSHFSFWASLPKWYSTSILPVSGALQLKISGAKRYFPMRSAIGAYSSVERPWPSSASGKNRLANPASRALALSASVPGCSFQVFQSPWLFSLWWKS